MQPGAEERLRALADRFAEAQDDGLFLRPHGEEARAQEHDHQGPHHHLDDREAASQRLRQGLGARILRGLGRRGGRERFVFVAHGQWLAEFVRLPLKRSKGGVRSSKIKVECSLSD